MIHLSKVPTTFEEAREVTKKILGLSLKNRSHQLVEAETEQLVMHAYRKVTGRLLSRVEFYLRTRETLPLEVGECLIQLVQSRAQGRLLQHITGVQVFLDHEYDVGPEVLIPRPETEILVRSACFYLNFPLFHSCLGLEIGVGSGVLSIELLAKDRFLKMVGSELCVDAVQNALKNARKILGHESNRLQILPTEAPLDIWSPFEKGVSPFSADFLITNPPYLLRTGEVDTDVEINEPHAALFAPPKDPLFFYRSIAQQAIRFLKPAGWVFAEIPHQRAEKILELFTNSQWEAKLLLDLTQRNRVLIAKSKVEHG